MPNINITVADKIARSDGANYICGNSDYVANFKFDSEWDAYETKTARFSYNGSYVDVVFEGEQCPIPIISDTYCFFVGVYAGNLHTTTPVRVPCKKSILCGSGSPAAPADDVYAQLMAKLNSLDGAEVDNATIIKDAEGKLKTSVGGYIKVFPDETIYENAALEVTETMYDDETGLYIGMAYMMPSPFLLEAGQEYTATVNGDSDKGIAFDADGIVGFGSFLNAEEAVSGLIGVMTTGSGETVDGESMAMGLLYYISAEQIGDTVSLKIVHHKTEIQQIDERVIPSHIVKVVEDDDGNASNSDAPTAKAVQEYVEDALIKTTDYSLDPNSYNFPTSRAVAAYVQSNKGVTSFNGKTGAVSGVASVNGKSGDVTTAWHFELTHNADGSTDQNATSEDIYNAYYAGYSVCMIFKTYALNEKYLPSFVLPITVVDVFTGGYYLAFSGCVHSREHGELYIRAVLNESESPYWDIYIGTLTTTEVT